MKKLVCALKDKTAEMFMAPVVVPTLAVMYRDLKDAVRPGQDNPLSKYPMDYELYQLGSFDDETGYLDVFVTPLRLASCDVFRDAAVSVDGAQPLRPDLDLAMSRN